MIHFFKIKFAQRRLLACTLGCPKKTKFWKLIWENFFGDVTSCPNYENKFFFFLNYIKFSRLFK